jgi:hypothetical protein
MRASLDESFINLPELTSSKRMIRANSEQVGLTEASILIEFKIQYRNDMAHPQQLQFVKSVTSILSTNYQSQKYWKLVLMM